MTSVGGDGSYRLPPRNVDVIVATLFPWLPELEKTIQTSQPRRGPGMVHDPPSSALACARESVMRIGLLLKRVKRRN